MEEESYAPVAESTTTTMQYYSSRIMSPEIVEIGEEEISSTTTSIGVDVYVAVGKDDLDVLKWALEHVVSPGSRVFLVHVFAPITFVRTPVGKLSKNQLNEEQLRVYVNEENNRRRNLLQKYIRLCIESKVTVDTMLIESNSTSKAILELIPVLNITNLVIGTKHPPTSRQRIRRKVGRGEVIKKNAPQYCEVSIVHEGKKVEEFHQQELGADHNDEVQVVHSPQHQHQHQQSTTTTTTPHPQRPWLNSERNFFQCVCFSGKSN